MRAAKAVAKSLLSMDFTDKALMDAVGEVQPGAVAGTAGAPPPRRRSGRAASRRRRVLASGAPLEPKPIGDRAVLPHDVGGPAIGEPGIRGSELPGLGSWSW